MRKTVLAHLAAPALLALLVGCGSAGGGGGDDDYDAASYLTVTNIVSSSSGGEDGGGGAANQIVANAVEQTDDSGTDGDPATVDADGTQDNGRPDPGEEVLTPLSAEKGTISFSNTPTGALGTGVNLTVYRVDIHYVDSFNRTHAYAPDMHYSVTLTVPSEGTADLVDLVLVPQAMKYGVRQSLLEGRADAEGIRNWNASVRWYAKDERNDAYTDGWAQYSIVFRNPMVEGL
ncbi:MAG: hypothetical protein HGA98_02720 [Deltaproteobacteria bacterium]|nr:hypothetical protein [Deltaproteobacteria bacterium]